MGFKSGRAGVIATGGGNVVGPATSTAGGFARYADTTGKLLVDSAATISNADVNAAAGIVYSKLNLALGIVNADVSATAAIAYSKLASMTSANILVGSVGNVATVTAVTGAISISNTGVTAYVGVVPLAQGGTNNANAAVNGGVAYSSAAAILISAAGTSGQYLKSAGAAAPVFTSFTQPTITRLTSGTGLTYTTPANVVRLKIRAIGGGGGGSASDTAGGNSGVTGTSTTFGNLTAAGGVGGVWNGAGGAGGAPTVGAGFSDVASMTGNGGGSWHGGNATLNLYSGGMGGAGTLGGVGAGTTYSGVGTAGTANSGSGGQGGGTNAIASSVPGPGGGAGAYIEAVTSGAPSATYTYTVGGGGNGGAPGQKAGGVGGSGIIIIEEFYQ